MELRLQEIVPIIECFDQPDFELLLSWLKNVIVWGLPEHAQVEMHFILETSQPKEAGKMVSNISEAIRRKYEESLVTGKLEGIEEGMLKAKLEDAQKMLAKGLALDLVLEITGLSPEQIIATNKNMLAKQ